MKLIYPYAVIVKPLSKVNFPITIPLLLINFNENQCMKFQKLQTPINSETLVTYIQHKTYSLN